MLTDKFSVFKTLIDRSVLFREVLNNIYDLKVSIFIVPDENLSTHSKRALLSLDRADATELLQNHIIEADLPKLLDGHLYQTRNRKITIGIIRGILFLPNGESRQRITLLSEGNRFLNGNVFVINQPIIIGA